MAWRLGAEYGSATMTKAAKLKFLEAKEDEWPVCPSCKKELRELKYKQRGWLSSITTFWWPTVGHS